MEASLVSGHLAVLLMAEEPTNNGTFTSLLEVKKSGVGRSCRGKHLQEVGSRTSACFPEPLTL